MSIRPIFRVASAGLDPRDVRLIEIVFQHSQYNKYDFQMLENLNLTRTDILIANSSDPAGLDALTAVGSFSRRIPTVSAVPRGAQASARHSITLDRLTLQLLPILNRLVEVEMLEPAVATQTRPLCDELTEIYADVAAGEQSCNLPQARAAEGRQAEAIQPRARAGAGIPVLTRQPAPVDASLSSGPPSWSASPVTTALTNACASAAAANAIARAAQQAPPRARLQALIADPSAAARQQLARALRRMGLEVQCVVSAAAAMQTLAAQHVDLVITESGLAETDGFDLIRRMRSQAAYRYTPVLLLRSRLHVMDATRARLAGDVTVLAKPLTRTVLESVVRDRLRNSAILDDLNELLSPG